MHDNAKANKSISFSINLNTLLTLLALGGICFTCNEIKSSHDAIIEIRDTVQAQNIRIVNLETQVAQMWHRGKWDMDIR